MSVRLLEVRRVGKIERKTVDAIRFTLKRLCIVRLVNPLSKKDLINLFRTIENRVITRPYKYGTHTHTHYKREKNIVSLQNFESFLIYSKYFPSAPSSCPI